ncbi:RagB/SusD family nutrient uptake outer membrane protein [Robertkochia solimangrovi]|uniref:RagB/SusD family nutrient uptake outer membrane protein n=1 Tax=Robertkochia solimangrovi TaxID=2213046 RepID=UPI00117DE23C|nr:RagB/SusD family nutrient uptake outer membrane protein [Robertkochia solimangrovi]TRZ42240.1 RagB/SusD family nutrient uptake outer membrane protein [Robertkochia solimangrovi]
MKKHIHYIVFTISFGLLLTSCDDYLDVEPKGVQLLQTVEDYDQWLNSTDLQTSLPNELNTLADNMDMADYTNPPSYDAERIYTWQSQFSEDPQATPVIWSDLYQNIYYFNTVLNGIDAASGGTDQERNSLRAEALLGRAFEYLYLVNLYGKVYDVSTAAQDLAVPFVTSNDLQDEVPERSSVQEIYDHIIGDIEEALSDLPADNSENRFRGSVAAAYGVLARTYFFMKDYERAAENATLALNSGTNSLVDFSLMSGGSEMPHLRNRESALYARLNTTPYFTIVPDITFIQSFDRQDLRLQYYYSIWDESDFESRGAITYWAYAYPPSTQNLVEFNWGPTVAEMHLILAEAATRSNDLTTALEELDLLRSKRFMPEDYTKYDPESPVQEEVLQKILEERNFEFSFSGMRWFDMRRLASEGLMPTVYRYDVAGNIAATLESDSNKYTLQIPLQVMYFNPDWPQNPTDQ